MPNFKTNADFPRQIFQGDAFEFTLTVNAVLTNYQVRCEIFDRFANSVNLATLNSGGADTQILLTPGVSSSTIVVYVPEDETSDFHTRSYAEVEIEAPSGKKYTIFHKEFKMNQEKLNWTTP